MLNRPFKFFFGDVDQSELMLELVVEVGIRVAGEARAPVDTQLDDAVLVRQSIVLSAPSAEAPAVDELRDPEAVAAIEAAVRRRPGTDRRAVLAVLVFQPSGIEAARADGSGKVGIRVAHGFAVHCLVQPRSIWIDGP